MNGIGRLGAYLFAQLSCFLYKPFFRRLAYFNLVTGRTSAMRPFSRMIGPTYRMNNINFQCAQRSDLVPVVPVLPS